MNRYHFDFGDSNDGPVGYCASIVAETPAQAVDLLRDQIRGHNLWDGYEIGDIVVYVNPEFVTESDIDAVDEVYEQEEVPG